MIIVCLLVLCTNIIHLISQLAACVHSDKCQQYVFSFSRCLSYYLSIWYCALGERRRQKIWQRRSCRSGNRPEGINLECQPLTLSVGSQGHTLAWWSLWKLAPGGCFHYSYLQEHSPRTILGNAILMKGGRIEALCSWYVTGWYMSVSVVSSPSL